MSSSANSFLPEDDNNEASSPVKPERNLLAAVLARAICDAFGSAHCERHVVRSARRWLFGKLTPTKPFSFAWVAINLDIDPKMLRKTLRQYESDPAAIQDRLTLLR
jgi:hypothetical protein